MPTVTVSEKIRSKGLPPLQMGVFEEKSSHTPGMHWVSDCAQLKLFNRDRYLVDHSSI